jgi:lipopolysaccharide biosynthesis glycosyltransferase
MAADENYVSPLLVTVMSLLETLRSGTGLDLYVMAGELTSGTRQKLEAIRSDRVALHWVVLDHSKLEPLRGHGYPNSSAANFRLIAGSSLPPDLKKVIYLDADILIQRDILELWNRPLEGNIALAVQDAYIQRFPAFLSPGGPERPYFNSGVMVIDLEAWRTAEIERRCLEGAHRFPQGTKWLDQHLLNVCLAGRWGKLSPVWNKQFFLDLLPDWRSSPYEEPQFREARHSPAIIHFCSRTKPWHAFCDHPWKEVLAYRAVLGNRAPIPQPSASQRVVEFFAAPHRRLLDLMAATFRARRRGHALRMMLPHMVRTAVLHPWTLLTVLYSVAHERAVLWLERRGGVR